MLMQQLIQSQMQSRKYPPSVPLLVLFRTVLSTPSTTWTTLQRIPPAQRARSVIPIWLLRWLSTPTTTSWLRQVRLCWLSPIRLTRAYCLCYSKLKLRSGCFLRGTNHICKSYVRTKGQSMTGCPFWVLIRPFDHPKISFPIPSKNYHSNPWLPVQKQKAQHHIRKSSYQCAPFT